MMTWIRNGIKLFAVFVCIASCLSCHQPSKQQFVVNGDHVFDRNGRVIDQSPASFDMDRVIITYLDLRVLDFELGDTPRGKIDRIISDNPEWHFVFVINAELQDTSLVVKKLNDYGCDFPVILDVAHEFEREYRLEHFLATTFVIKGNKHNNLGVIGSSNSFFDSEFDKYKQSVRF